MKPAKFKAINKKGAKKKADAIKKHSPISVDPIKPKKY